MSMHLLVTWGSKRGGTEGIAAVIAEALRMRGYDVTEKPANHAPAPDDYDAVVIGGALYANRWHRHARRYANRHAKALRRRPVWFFSSGPLDETAAKSEIPPVPQVEVLMQRIGGIGHRTFGGRLEADATGFPARAMAKTHAGDWRDPELVRAWANDIADHLLSTSPGYAIEPPGRAVPRLVEHALVGWAACAAVMAGMLALASTRAAVITHAAFAPLVFAAVASSYFRARGARQPLPTAAAFAAIVGVLDLGFIGSLGFTGFWLPLALIFVVTWTVGGIRSMMPFPKPNRAAG